MPSQYFSENKIISNSIALTLKFYYVYKLILPSGHYYVGQTGDLTSRLAQHMFTIYDVKHDLAANFVPFHKKAAELLVEEFDRYYDELRHIRNNILQVRVIAFVANPEYAKMIEREEIAACSSDSLCLNVTGKRKSEGLT